MSTHEAAIRSCRDSLAWQKAVALVESTYKLTARMPANERCGSTSPLRRAAVSIASIAEGHGLRLALLEPEVAVPLTEECDELGRILRGLRKSLDHQLACHAIDRSRYSSLTTHH